MTHATDLRELEADPFLWAATLFPNYVTDPYGQHQKDLWQWAWSIRPGVRPSPYVAVWNRGGAKALDVDTPIPTPHGWVAMGDIAPGMTVFNERGEPVRVSAVSPIDERACYELTFKGGGTIVASSDHLWTVTDCDTRREWREAGAPADWPMWAGVRTRNTGPCQVGGCSRQVKARGLCPGHYQRVLTTGDADAARPLRPHARVHRLTTGAVTLTTDELVSSGLKDEGEWRWSIPTTDPLNLSDRDLPIDPYVLGAWLGDGTSAAGSLTVGFDDADAMRTVLATVGCQTSWYQYGTAWRVNIVGLNATLHANGLRNNKHVPLPYLRAGTKQRLSLLQGLMDTDGTHAADKAAASFTSTRQILADGVAELARSLGLRASVGEQRATLRGRDCGPVWRTTIATTDLPLFRLPRKRAAQEAIRRQPLNAAMHYLTAARPVGYRAARCIIVDSPAHLFLAGPAMIPTHNSTSAEMVAVALGARRRRRYGLYIGGVQDSADDHVGNIGAMLESAEVEAFYPELASRMVGKYGNSKGWRRNRLRCSNGFTIDAIGLDTAARGIKLEDQRPDFLIVDDVDEQDDTARTTTKKMNALTRKLLPAGASDTATLAIQNLVHPDSIFSRLVDGRADFLADRIVSGPIPAVLDLEVEQRGGRYIIVNGTATWAGMDLIRCQEIMDDVGLTAFLAEAQHDVEAPPGGMFDHLEFERCDWSDLPELVRTVVWVDPAVTDTDNSDAQGIQADAMGANGKIYRLWSWEQRTTPVDAMTRAVRKAVELGADEVGVETDQGGDTWQSVYKEAVAAVRAEDPTMTAPRFRWEKAGAGHGSKRHRAAKMLAGYETGLFVHVRGTHHVLERGLKRFPETKPYDLVDAAVWSAYSLTKRAKSRGTKSYADQIAAAT